MDTRAQILTAAIDVYGQHGFRGATTRRIADAAGVNEVTVFRHFGSKDALLAEAIRHAASQSARIVLPVEPVDPLADLTAWAQSQLEHLRGRSSIIRTCMSELGERPELDCAAIGPRSALSQLTAYLRALRAKGRVRSDAPLDVAAAMLLGVLFSDAMSREMLPEMFPPENQAARSYVSLLLHALGMEGATGRPATARAPAPPSLPDATGA
jgi:AcrR family transcriptional regulator